MSAATFHDQSDLSASAIQIAQVFLGETLGPESAPSGSILVVVPSVESAEALLGDLEFFVRSASRMNASSHGVPEVCAFPGWDVLPFDTLSPTTEIIATRIATLQRLSTHRPTLVVATIDALLQKLVAPAVLRDAVRRIAIGDALDRDELTESLIRGGYQQSSLVEELGQLAIRGAVVDFYPPGARLPVRIEMFGNVIQSIRLFDPGTQRSSVELEQFEVLPVRELFLPAVVGDGQTARLKKRASDLGVPLTAVKAVEEALSEGLQLPGMEQLQALLGEPLVPIWDYLGADAKTIVVDETGVVAAADEFERLIGERSSRAEEQGTLFPVPGEAYAQSETILSRIAEHKLAAFNTTRFLREEDFERPPEAVENPSRKVFSLAGLHAQLLASRHQDRPFLPLAQEIKHRTEQGYRLAIVVSHQSRERRIEDLLGGYQIPVAAVEASFREWLKMEGYGGASRTGVSLLHGELSAGIRVPDLRTILIPEREIFPEISARRTSNAAKTVRRFLGSVSQLKENDYVVHVEHGIGIYRGLRQIEVDGKPGDFLFLEYADEAKLFVPVENIGKIQKYASAGAKKPALSKLGGKSWNTTKAKVKENVAELAGQLLNILAARELSEGVPFGPVDADDLAFADTFPFDETPDQEKAIRDVLGDLARGKPMDRLVCGDVGYGKTEVALRAAFKVVNSGKQVAVLVPTTILADQHYSNFKARFADSPFRVACVSRFQTPAENKAVLAEVAAGRVDIIIGTHRLLQRDVLFKDLGIIIIDEEHRFGVAHKEKLKRLRAEVHVLTLTATPIPRTLHMSLVGIRDLSIIETAPVNRQVIRTYLAPYSETMVREAILREIGRSGQVFYIYNRVENIAAIADEISELVPEAKVVFAHGQMKDTQLEEVMHQFSSGAVNVLVSTTIVESGLDIPNANTIIIRNADRFGLAELYQLRGRVGRSSRRAYAYLLIPDPKTLGPDAKKRLQVLQSLDDLGIGFRLALQDMEIRGAGNLLGKDQSGHIDLVGYELYSRILREAVEELRKRAPTAKPVDEPRPVVDPEVRIGFPAHIPPWYVPDVGERLLLYQRLIDLRDETEAGEVLEEITDRFGNPPDDVGVLLELMVFRGLLRRSCAVSATYRGDTLTIAFHPHAGPDPQTVVRAVKSYEGALRVTPSMSLSLTIPHSEIRSPKDLCGPLEELLEKIEVLR
ncbi:MAG: transcription-repair coupling factor [Bdellovibrionota bacterium]